MRPLPKRFSLRPLQRFLAKKLSAIRAIYNFDGVDDRGQLAFRAINPDGDNVFEFWTPDATKSDGVIISQNVSSNFVSREFQLWTDTAATKLKVLIGGVATDLGVVKPKTRYRLELIGAIYTLKSADGTIVRSGAFARGSAREPSSITKICANTDGAGHANFFIGTQSDIMINGNTYPLSSREFPVQLPTNAGLGNELLITTALENPSSRGSQWTYLGQGRWQLNGDGGYNELIFIANQPLMMLVEFEIESISGGSIRCFSDGSPNSAMSSPIFSAPGKCQWFTTNRIQSGNAYQSFVRNSGPVTCIIKNISIKPLWLSDNINLWGGVDLSKSNSANLATVTIGSAWTITRTGASVPTDGARRADITTLEVGAMYALFVTSTAPVHLAIYDGNSVQKELRQSNTLIFRALPVTKIYVSPVSQNVAVTVSNPVLVKLQSVCNPMTLANTNPDRWQSKQ